MRLFVKTVQMNAKFLRNVWYCSPEWPEFGIDTRIYITS